MSYASEHHVHCAAVARGCSASFPGSKWGAIRATADGWLIQRNGTAWCPDHLPAWAARWRARPRPPEPPRPWPFGEQTCPECGRLWREVSADCPRQVFDRHPGVVQEDGRRY